MERADPKKFEVLELLSNLLNWDDEKKQLAGLIGSTHNAANPPQPTRPSGSFARFFGRSGKRENET